jgi:hypothetical protein
MRDRRVFVLWHSVHRRPASEHAAALALCDAHRRGWASGALLTTKQCIGVEVDFADAGREY